MAGFLRRQPKDALTILVEKPLSYLGFLSRTADSMSVLTVG